MRLEEQGILRMTAGGIIQGLEAFQRPPGASAPYTVTVPFMDHVQRSVNARTLWLSFETALLLALMVVADSYGGSPR